MRKVIAACGDGRGAIWAASTEVPGDGESHRAHNQLHVFEAGAGRLVADWTGWQLTDIADAFGTIVCTSVKRHVYTCCNGRLGIIQHPEGERALNCCATTPGGLYLGGSTGYFLTSGSPALELEPHNLRDFGLTKPGRDIHAIVPQGHEVLMCGAGRLVVSMDRGRARLLVAPGPTAATPNLHGIAVVGARIALASWKRLWWLDGHELVPVSVPSKVHEAAGLIAAVGNTLLVGGQRVYSVSEDGTWDCLYDHSSQEAWVARFLSNPTRAVWSTGDIVELSDPPRWLGNILESDEGA